MRKPKYGIDGLSLQPTVDNSVLPRFPLDEIKGGSDKDIPILMGTNLDEWRYLYLFTWPSPIMDGKLGACHALDLPFVFGGVEENFSGVRPDAEALANNIQNAWLAFAHKGAPASGNLSS